MKITQSHRPGLAKIDPRPRTIYCSQGRVVLATDLDGFIGGNARHGLFVGETRMLSRYRHLVQSKPPQMVVVSNVEQHSWLGYYVILPPGLKWTADSGSGAMQPVSEETIELKISRTVGLGVHEDIDFTNFTQQPVRLTFEIEIDADFADQAETGRRKQHGKLRKRWRTHSRGTRELRFDYHAEHQYSHQGNRGTAELKRGLIVHVEKSGSVPSYRHGTIRFGIFLKPRRSWHACVKFIPVFDGGDMLPLYGCREFFGTHNELDRRRRIFLSESTQFETVEESTLAATVTSALNQAKVDLADLRLPDLDGNERAWVTAAGLPIYVALFGRDTLTASWQAALASTAMLRGTLSELPKWQGKVENDWRDEQPGRMLHEAHTGPLAILNYNPRSRYYGAATTSGFYPVVLSELWHWTGDKSAIQPLIEPALRALDWKDKYTDRFGDGFYDYQSRSIQGNRNQGWKDSGDAIVYEDGRQVDPPISTCEEQAFVYVAKLRMAEILWTMGDRESRAQNVP